MSLITPPTARNKAIQYLAMREHSYLELSRKLKNKGYEDAEIDTALGKLIDDNLLSDSRFGEVFVRSKALKGQGPVRIRMELREKGLNDAQIAFSFSENSEIDWNTIIERTFLKKYSITAEVGDVRQSENFVAHNSTTAAEKAKQWRFLQYRGFSQTQISELFRRLSVGV